MLRNIEERLEQISEAINKIDDDSNNNHSLSSGLELWAREEQLQAAELFPNNSSNRYVQWVLLCSDFIVSLSVDFF